jgi:hypothetical protein
MDPIVPTRLRRRLLSPRLNECIEEAFEFELFAATLFNEDAEEESPPTLNRSLQCNAC